MSLVEMLENLSQAGITLAHVEDEEAMLSFILDGQRYEWNLTVDSDWVDPAIFTPPSD